MKTEAGNVQENRYDSEGRRYELLGNGRRISFVYHNGEFLHEKGEELMNNIDNLVETIYKKAPVNY